MTARDAYYVSTPHFTCLVEVDPRSGLITHTAPYLRRWARRVERWQRFADDLARQYRDTLRIVKLACVLLALLLPGLSAAACPKVPRSAALIRAFKRTHVCPSTKRIDPHCRDIVDHVVPLCLIGKEGDALWNLQYQSIADAKAKDRIERQMCRVKPRTCPHQGD